MNLPHRSVLAITVVATLAFTACSASDSDGAVAVPGADPVSAPSTSGSPTTDPGTPDPEPVPEPQPQPAPDQPTSGGQGFIDVAGDRYEISESAFCFIDGSTGSTGSFLGTNSAGRSGVLSIESDPGIGEAIAFNLDINSLDLAAEAPETSPQYEARNQEVFIIGELNVTIDGGTFAGSAIAADIASSAGFQASTPLTFSATC